MGRLPRTRTDTRAGVTIRDVAARAGVSVMTASNVLTGKGRMTSQTRASVLRAIDELRYVPSNAARALASATDLRIALLYPDVDSYFLGQLVMGSLDGAAATGAHLVVEKYHVDSADEALRAVDALIASGCGALLLTSPLSELVAQSPGRLPDVPLATIGGGSALDGMLSVRVDNEAAARAVADHLVELGHRDIGFVAGPPGHSASRDRLAGFAAGLARAGIALRDDRIQPGNYDFASGWAAAAALLDREDRPTAIFATSDDMAAAVVAFGLRLGLDLPGDLSVVGFDDTPLTTRIWPAITTVHQPVVAMADRAVRWLVGRVRDRAPRVDVTEEVPYRLVLRQTTAPPRGDGRRKVDAP